jgi:cytoskeletal protein CcmA (bactofilin family)
MDPSAKDGEDRGGARAKTKMFKDPPQRRGDPRAVRPTDGRKEPMPDHTLNDLPEMTVIGPDTKIKGEMYFEKSARILGSFEGKITAQGEVQIGVGALCNAAVEADRVIVDGRVHGPITARDRLTLTANAQVQGDLTAGTLVVAEGASFVGHCQVGPHAQELTKGNSAEQTRQAPRQAVHTEPKPQPAQHAAQTNGQAALDMTPPWARNNAGAA